MVFHKVIFLAHKYFFDALNIFAIIIYIIYIYIFANIVDLILYAEDTNGVHLLIIDDNNNDDT